MPFPSVLSTFSRPTASNRLDNPSHSALHNTVSSALGQIEAVIGVEGANSVVGSLEYLIKSPASDGGGHVQSANKGGTGQTSYTKGDILVASSTSVLTKLAAGANDTVLVADSAVAAGVKWGAAPTTITTSTIAVASVWTKPSSALPTSRVFVELWGAGGSGTHTTANNEAGAGGGGGYASGWYSASILTSVVINVGRGGDSTVGGAAGIAGRITVWDPTTSLLTAYGGAGGIEGATGAGGGGGGGVFASGSAGSGSAPGLGGVTGGGLWTVDLTQQINLGNNGTVSVFTRYAPMGGAGASGINNGANAASMQGGFAVYGGAGGGSATSSVAGGSTMGGISTFGGAGGGGKVQTTGSAMAGFIPGGGGGAGHGAGSSSGPGAHGMAKITVFL